MFLIEKIKKTFFPFYRAPETKKIFNFKSIMLNLAGALGFEPRMAVPKTAALPLGYAPFLVILIYHI